MDAPVSYTIRLIDEEGNTCQTTPHEEGGTIMLGGDPSCTMSVTYNYTPVICMAASHVWMTNDALDWPSYELLQQISSNGLNAIHELRSYTVLGVFTLLAEMLGTHKYDDYWAATPGNVGHMFSVLRDWATQHPNATFVKES